MSNQARFDRGRLVLFIRFLSFLLVRQQSHRSRAISVGGRPDPTGIGSSIRCRFLVFDADVNGCGHASGSDVSSATERALETLILGVQRLRLDFSASDTH
jgi:hypothetical protein